MANTVHPDPCDLQTPGTELSTPSSRDLSHCRDEGSGGDTGHTPPSYSTMLHSHTQIAQDSCIHGGVATCCPVTTGPLHGPSETLLSPPNPYRSEQQAQGPALPRGHPRALGLGERRSWKTCVVPTVPSPSLWMPSLVTLPQSKTLRTHCVQVLCWGFRGRGPDTVLRTLGRDCGRKLRKSWSSCSQGEHAEGRLVS